MLYRRFQKPRRLHADLALVRRHFAEPFGTDAGDERYFSWPRSTGVDPETGRMTAAGFEPPALPLFPR